MVSTRGVRYKFSEGERVLCYEPDPTKAKVLYDSKVLEVIETKDKRGRRTVEYLIHFQGWNSSWDRCVSEDFVLKDTEENRQLQRDLAEKSQLQLGAYLYRRERKKGTSTGGAGPAKRARHAFDDDGSSSSTQPDEGETGDTDSSSGSGHAQIATLPPQQHAGRAHITLPHALRARLTFDYHLVMKRGRLSRLPATPCVADILESFVRWYARAGAWRTPARARAEHHKPDLLDVSSRLNLVREVADGLRVYFDFVLPCHLLYKQEIPQYHEVCGIFVERMEVEIIKEEPPSCDEEVIEAAELDLKSPKLPEYAHLPPDPADNVQESPSELLTPKIEIDEKMSPEPVTKMDSDDTGTAAAAPIKPKDNSPTVRPACVTRRLRSHKQISVSHSEPEEPTPSTSAAEPRAFENFSSSIGSSGSSISEGWGSRTALGSPPAAPAHPVPNNGRTKLSQLFDMVAKWQIIPREGTEHLPCRIYGAIHFARLFVRLPDFLNATQMPDSKLKLILKYVDMFIQYLNEHNEWFGEMYYVADGASRSR